MSKHVRKPYVSVDFRGKGHTHGTIDPKVVVLHDTESSDKKGVRDISGVLNYLYDTPDELNVHICVDKEGYSGQGAKLTDLCYHAKGANSFSIGIEMIGYARFSMKVWAARRKQIDTVAKWLAYIHWRFDIPLVLSTTHGIARHSDFPAGGHEDPGMFPMGYVLKKARKYAKTGW